MGVSPGAASEWCQSTKITYPLLADPEREIIKEYGALGLMQGYEAAIPSMFIIGTDGHIVWESPSGVAIGRPRTEEILEHLP